MSSLTIESPIMAFLALPTWGEALGFIEVCSTSAFLPVPVLFEPYFVFFDRISFIVVCARYDLFMKKLRYGPLISVFSMKLGSFRELCSSFGFFDSLKQHRGQEKRVPLIG